MTERKKDTLKKVLKKIKPYSAEVLVSSLLTLVSVALTLYVPILIGKAIDQMIAAGKVDFAGIFRILIQIALCVGGTALSQWIMNVLNNRVTFQVVKDLRNELFSHLQTLPVQ